MANRAVREKKKKGTEKFWGSFSCSNNCFILPKVPYIAKKSKKYFKKGLKKLNFDSVA